MNLIFEAKGIIYLIENWVNGRIYVGQTIKTFANRYGGTGLWWHYTNCKPLLADVDKHGPASFRVRVLEHSKTMEELNVLEARYAEQYNSYFPNGYNVIPCGKNNRRSPKKSNFYYLNESASLKSPNGEIFNVSADNLDTFCNERGLEKYRMWTVVTRKANKYRGWTLADSPDRIYKGGKRFTFYDQDGKTYKIRCLRRFCDEQGLNYDRMTSMTVGRVPQSQGFALSQEGFSNMRKRRIVTLVKGDKEVTLNNVNKDSASIGLDFRYVHDLARGKIQSWQGWSLKNVKMVPF